MPVIGLGVGHAAARPDFGYVPCDDVDIVTVQLQLLPDLLAMAGASVERHG